MHLKITIVVDNRVGQGLSGEHGFSLWIETGTERVLFDTGQGSALAENARIRSKTTWPCGLGRKRDWSFVSAAAMPGW